MPNSPSLFSRSSSLLCLVVFLAQFASSLRRFIPPLLMYHVFSSLYTAFLLSSTFPNSNSHLFVPLIRAQRSLYVSSLFLDPSVSSLLLLFSIFLSLSLSYISLSHAFTHANTSLYLVVLLVQSRRGRSVSYQLASVLDVRRLTNLILFREKARRTSLESELRS